MTLLMQIFGIVAAFFSILSFQMKTHKSIMLVQFIAVVFFASQYATSYFGLGQDDALIAFLLDILCLFRCVIFYFDDIKFFSGKIWIYLLCAGVVVIGILSWKSWVSVVLIVSMMLNVISFSCKDPQNTRKVILFSSPLALLYNVLLGVVGGSVFLIPIAAVINEILSSASCILALIRYREKKTEN